MSDIPYSPDELWRVLTYLAARKGSSVENFVDDCLLAMRNEEIDSLASHFLDLSEAEKERFFAKLGLSYDFSKKEEAPASSPPPCVTPKKYSLEQLKDMEVGELVKSKPSRLWINQTSYEARSWKDVCALFVQALLKNNLLNRNLLPFYPSGSSRKAFINSFPSQPNGSRAGLFVKVADNVYVDIKQNAKYCVLNIWRTLLALQLQDKWKVELEFKDCRRELLKNRE